jgi:hypothetical protein
MQARSKTVKVFETSQPSMAMTLEQLMSSEELQATGSILLTAEQQEALVYWGMRMYQLGQHVVADIEEVKYDGRLIILDDGSRWEVESFDSSTADMWGAMDKVVVIDDEMYKLEDLEKVSVTQEY